MSLSEEEKLDRLLEQDIDDFSDSSSNDEPEELQTELGYYQDDELPEHACEYCGIHEKDSVV